MNVDSRTFGRRSWTPKVTYRVEVWCPSNDLRGMVEVVSLTKKSASDMALRVFFRGAGWQVTKVTQIEEEL